MYRSYYAKTLYARTLQFVLIVLATASCSQVLAEDVVSTQIEQSNLDPHRAAVPGNHKHWRDQLPELSQDAADYYVEPKAHSTTALHPRVAEKTRTLLDKESEAADVSFQGSFKTDKTTGYLEDASVQGFKVKDSNVQDTEKLSDILVNTKTSVENTSSGNTSSDNTSSDNKSYTVQLGAFTSVQALQGFVDQKGLTALEGWQTELSRKQGQQWHVIAWGRFHSRQQAETAWLKEQHNFPKVKYWVTKVDSFSQEYHQAGR